MDSHDGNVGGKSDQTEASASSDAGQAAKYLKDSMLLNQLTEHVYKLLLEDLRSQRERLGNYGS